jgi:integrase/recombinase XerD
MSDPWQVRVSGPLAPFVTGFAAELQRQGYTPISTAHQLQLAAHLSCWLAGEGQDASGLSLAATERFLDARRAAGYTGHLTGKALAPLLAYLRELGVAPTPSPPLPTGPVEDLLRRYRGYLTSERGLGERTTANYTEAVRPFLEDRLSAQGLGLGQLSSAEVTEFVTASLPRQTRGKAKGTVTALRSLLGFLHLEGMTERPLAAAVPSVAGWQLAGLPKGLEPDQVQSLLYSCDRDTAKGRRDFAVLTALVRLGLRAGEVAALELGDIDWRAGEIVVRGKGSRDERLPLPADVGEAIAAYLREGRPATAQDRAVFVRAIAPRRALSRIGVSDIVATAARRAGLEQTYAHRLRHTAATETLRAGASLPEVGQLLRQYSPLTTAIYAKVDREALRCLPLPWPGGAR